MESAIVLSTEDIKKILAEKFNVPEKSVIKSQYSWTIIGVKCSELIKK